MVPVMVAAPVGRILIPSLVSAKSYKQLVTQDATTPADVTPFCTHCIVVLIVDATGFLTSNVPELYADVAMYKYPESKKVVTALYAELDPAVFI